MILVLSFRREPTTRGSFGLFEIRNDFICAAFEVSDTAFAEKRPIPSAVINKINDILCFTLFYLHAIKIHNLRYAESVNKL